MAALLTLTSLKGVMGHNAFQERRSSPLDEDTYVALCVQLEDIRDQISSAYQLHADVVDPSYLLLLTSMEQDFEERKSSIELCMKIDSTGFELDVEMAMNLQDQVDRRENIENRLSSHAIEDMRSAEDQARLLVNRDVVYTHDLARRLRELPLDAICVLGAPAPPAIFPTIVEEQGETGSASSLPFDEAAYDEEEDDYDGAAPLARGMMQTTGLVAEGSSSAARPPSPLLSTGGGGAARAEPLLKEFGQLTISNSRAGERGSTGAGGFSAHKIHHGPVTSSSTLSLFGDDDEWWKNTPDPREKDDDASSVISDLSIPEMKVGKGSMPNPCDYCGVPSIKVCSRCRKTNYCSNECQGADWRGARRYSSRAGHQAVCSPTRSISFNYGLDPESGPRPVFLGVEGFSHIGVCEACCDDEKPVCTLEGCEHKYCEGCLRKLFKNALGDPSFFPAKCCKNEIDDESLLNAALRRKEDRVKYNQRKQELATNNKMYCSNPRCSALVLLDFVDASGSDGRYACMECDSNMCVLCKKDWHEGLKCGQSQSDVDDNAVLALADVLLWARCGNCKEVIEHRDGCFHMTCRCKYEFCYSCHSEWDKTKKCCPKGCSLFSHGEESRLAHQRARQLVPLAATPEVYQAAVSQARLNLRRHEMCDHHFTSRAGGVACSTCNWVADLFIYQCTLCDHAQCRSCKNNRW